MPGPARSTTFLLADLTGYTALTEAHGDLRAAGVARDFCSAVRELSGVYGAEEVKTIGDAILLHVPDAGQAVHLGARLVNDVGGRHHALGIGVGMHTGTAVQEGGDWFGAGVNVAARVADLAGPDEILLTEQTRLAAGKAIADGQLRERGERSFKNVRHPVRVLELVPAGRLSGTRLPVDPVCRMAVEPEQAGPSVLYRRTRFHFCSPECHRAFEDDPAAFGVRLRGRWWWRRT